ncbi:MULTISPECIES: methionine ABC transporter ATP-binding protein [Leuconostoc gelidum group]|uniref:Methionine ABC transporter ATP-binding protein n=1 Tax=Leuconostoc gelidum subsp. gelidum TaxID=1607839 RepID=A0AB35G1T5_LEUGE|nr:MULTISPECIES: methionine ABC transporter ATP-binding protein [Leuconostoc gelidum group]AFS39910.1 methionine import ATP-binding protein MetN [Leuconostoc gelidum JB7]MBZ5952564.1 methionine ABC transporter ATP-binding protein [Leuconostoc gasicomitatum]MBZ5964567.1 methionine ABC transporter ATP-binding protein [Leuconostoc gelidum subsp. gelidum]MBZ5974828.1 methionine ABC transporter ATP-binding protein [Leuconostoc gelidum subsp. gelidum]MBZ5977668.1 methionine ABC transporter ATP-bindi
MSNPIISLNHIDVTFYQKKRTITAVKDVSITINRGDVYGIVGYSGAGKSTLVRVINLLQEPTSGSVIVNGETFFQADNGNNKKVRIKANDLRNRRRKIGMIFQHFNLLNERTVTENVAFALQHSKLTQDQKKLKVTELLKLVDLTDRAEQYPSQLSGGQKQRVAIARALANDPEILISDEATSALDPKTTNQILSLLKKLNEKLGLTIVLITHEMQAVKEIANKVAVMQNGEIIERGSLLDIFAQPTQQLTKEFIETATNIDKAIATISAQPLVQNLSDNELFIRLSYVGATTDEPLIAGLFRDFQVTANILYGNVEILQNTPVGSLLVILSGTDEQIKAATSTLADHHVEIEILKGGK